jgi:hypothetical protein
MYEDEPPAPLRIYLWKHLILLELAKETEGRPQGNGIGPWVALK